MFDEHRAAKEICEKIHEVNTQGRYTCQYIKYHECHDLFVFDFR